MPRAPGERWECEACAEKLIGALNPKTGKVAPITEAPYADGNVLLHRVHVEQADTGVTARTGPLVVCAWTLGVDVANKAREAGVELRRNHFQSCPEAERFRP